MGSWYETILPRNHDCTDIIKGFFQSDYDLDCFFELEESGLTGDDRGWNRSAKSHKQVSFYVAFNPAALRRQLDDGALAKVIACNLERLKDPNRKCEAFTPEYKLVLMAAVAMKFGCRISSELRNYTAAKYRRVGIQRDAISQMKFALRKYKDGVPYDFGGKCLLDIMEDSKKGIVLQDRLAPGLINTTCPRYGAGHRCAETGMAYSEHTVIEKNSAAWKRERDEDANLEELAKDVRARAEVMRIEREYKHGNCEFSDDECGYCGLGYGKLKLCARCNRKRYCSRECQVAHWATHKITCGVSELSKVHVGVAEPGKFPDLASLRENMPETADGGDTRAGYKTISAVSDNGTTFEVEDTAHGSVFTVRL